MLCKTSTPQILKKTKLKILIVTDEKELFLAFIVIEHIS